MPLQLRHRIIVHGFSAQITVFNIALQQTLPLQLAADPTGNRTDQGGKLLMAGRLDPDKAQTFVRVIDVDTIQKQHVEVQIQVERAAEALNQRHCAGPGVLVSESRLLDEMRGNHAIDDPQHLAHERWPVGKQVA